MLYCGDDKGSALVHTPQVASTTPHYNRNGVGPRPNSLLVIHSSPPKWKSLLFYRFCNFFLQQKTPVQSLTGAELFRLRNGTGHGYTPGPSWASAPTPREQGPARPARCMLAFHLAIQVIVIVFCVHTATCATATALAGASSTLVPWRESVYTRKKPKKKIWIGLLQGFDSYCSSLLMTPTTVYKSPKQLRNCTMPPTKLTKLPEAAKTSTLLKCLGEHFILSNVIITDRTTSKAHGFFKVVSANLRHWIILFYFLWSW